MPTAPVEARQAPVAPWVGLAGARTTRVRSMRNACNACGVRGQASSAAMAVGGFAGLDDMPLADAVPTRHDAAAASHVRSGRRGEPCRWRDAVRAQAMHFEGSGRPRRGGQSGRVASAARDVAVLRVAQSHLQRAPRVRQRARMHFAEPAARRASGVPAAPAGCGSMSGSVTGC